MLLVHLSKTRNTQLVHGEHVADLSRRVCMVLKAKLALEPPPSGPVWWQHDSWKCGRVKLRLVLVLSSSLQV